MSPKPKATSSKKSKSTLVEPPKQRKAPSKPSKKPKNPESTQAPRKKLKSTNPETETNILPQICNKHWDKFENDLKTREVDKITEKVNLCAARMHGFEVYNTHFLSLPFLRLAIVDCLLNRKWDNLLRLVIRLSRNYMDPVFRMPIRHLCQILKTYHPAIRGTEIADQINLVVEKFEKKSETRKNLTNVV
ncbi:unnamed protein product [Ceutorhynchus assimilis]|uniref:Uncharacterized protein n=1 Tax=Ceutorhynchus assimilis TaxID=467358 RepID=A0A9N9MLZ7_9CUCU|nr:unnamed protein product [Ceutorhynchus assimilis]